jgi:photosystem II stability/assembly factor-like uncharacterized protein
VGLAAHHPVHFALVVFLAGAAALGTNVRVTGARASMQSTASTMRAATGTWEAQSSGTRQALFAVSCFDGLRCKAVGAGGTVRYTKNGGMTWRAQSNPLAGSSTILYRIACVRVSTCYVISRPNLVLVTHNGGVTWSTHRIPLQGLGPGLTDPNCVSGQEADLRGRLALCRLGLLDLACISASTCYVVATPSAVFLTTDGGSTWKRQRIPATAPCQGISLHGVCGGPGPGRPYPLEWISCGSGLPCRAGGSVFIDPRAGSASLVIEASKPGGPWTPVRNQFPYASAPESAVCTTTTRCFGIWTTSPFAPGNEIWLSTDGGANWGGLSSGSPRIRNAIACPGARTCYSVGNQGTITASMNGGTFVAQQSRTTHDLYGVTCVDVNACFAVGNKGAIVGPAHGK